MKYKRTEADVVVVGGGTAGCFAAISAADAGAKCILIEKNGKLGGTMTTAGVNFPGLFHAFGKQIIGGRCMDLIERADKLGMAKVPKMEYAPVKHWKNQIVIDSFALTVLLEETCVEYGVDVRMHTMLAAAEEKTDGVKITVATKNGMETIFARTAIDCTGDANLVGLCGGELLRNTTPQPATLNVRFDGYGVEDIDCETVYDLSKNAIKDGRLSEWLTPKKVMNCLRNHNANIHVRCDTDADGSNGKTRLEMRARKVVFELLRFFREELDLKNAVVSSFSEECGVRETCRILGEHMISADEYRSGVVFPDAVCYAFYPVDLHVPEGVFPEPLKEGIVPTVPYRAMIPKGKSNLLAAGRIISSDVDANSALRVQAPCMAEGQVAGVAAALAAKFKIPVRDIERLHRVALINELTRQGAIVPENTRIGDR